MVKFNIAILCLISTQVFGAGAESEVGGGGWSRIGSGSRQEVGAIFRQRRGYVLVPAHAPAEAPDRAATNSAALAPEPKEHGKRWTFSALRNWWQRKSSKGYVAVPSVEPEGEAFGASAGGASAGAGAPIASVGPSVTSAEEEAAGASAGAIQDYDAEEYDSEDSDTTGIVAYERHFDEYLNRLLQEALQDYGAEQ